MQIGFCVAKPGHGAQKKEGDEACGRSAKVRPGHGYFGNAVLKPSSPETQLQAEVEGALEVWPEVLQTLLSVIHDRLDQLNEDVTQF